MIILENNKLKVEISEHGAELVSAWNKEAELEYIWYADPKYWGRHAPNLFPIVGRLQGDQYELAGQTYYMNQHGFARNMDFMVINQQDDAVRLRLEDSESTRRVYPFAFTFDVIFTLIDSSLRLNTWCKTQLAQSRCSFQSAGTQPLICHLMVESFRTITCP